MFSQTDTFIASTCIGMTTHPQNRLYTPLAEDFDGDTDIDIVVLDESGIYRLFTNDGTNNFTDTQILTGLTWSTLISKDLDNDGDIDIVSSAGKIFINNGSAVFTELPGTFFTATGSIGAFRVADFNGDTKQDIIWLNATSNSTTVNQIWFNNGTTGNASFVLGTEIQNLNGYTNLGSVAGDIDNDGDIDLVFCQQGGWNGRVFTNNGSGLFTNTQNLPTYTGEGFLADWDNDGDLDFLAYDYYNNWGLRLWKNNGTGTFGPVSTNSLITMPSVGAVDKIIDLNGDTWLDVVLRNGSGTRYFLNSGCQLTLATQVLSNSYNGIAISDFNNDSKPDFFNAARDGQSCININDLNIQSYVAITAPSVSSPINYFVGETPSQLSASGTNLLWYTTSSGGTGSATAPTPSTATTGNTSYWVSSTNANGCESERTEVIVTVSLPATHLNFDGVNDHVNLGTSLATALNGTTALTLEAWINPSVLNGWNNIITDYNGSYHKLLLRVRNNNNIQFWLNGTVLNSSFTVPLDTWTHIAAVYDGSNMYVYANGVLVASQPATVSLPTTTDQFNIGSRIGSNTENFTGSIDEVRVWTTARTAEQINGSMNCELQGNETGILAYYKFNQGIDQANNSTETTLTDITSNGYNGTLANFALTGATSNWLAGSPVETGSSIPSTPSVTTPVTYNQGDTASTLSATIGSGGTGLLWYTSATGGTGSTSAPTPDTSTVGSSSYWVSSTNANGCESERVEIVVNVNAEATHLNFDGSNDYVSCGTTNLPTGTSARTIEAWIKTTQTTGSQSIINYGNQTINNSRFGFINASGNLYFVGEGNDYNTNTLIADGNWHHIAATYEASTLKIYIDGALNATVTKVLNTNNNIFNIGASCNPTPGEFFNGSIDEVRIWDVALSQTDIQDTMNCELVNGQNNVVAYYKFNQGFDATDNTSVTTLIDETGNHNGTLINFALTGATSNWQSGSTVTTGNTCSAILSSSGFEAIANLKVYPNPSNGIFTINSEEVLDIKVYDLIGKLIYSNKVNSGINQIDISNYSNGIYLLQYSTTSGKTNSIKLIKN